MKQAIKIGAEVDSIATVPSNSTITDPNRNVILIDQRR